MLNLDTHMLVHALQGSLKPKERELLSGEPWSISGIVLWELAMLVQRERVDIDLESPEFSRSHSRIHIWPLDLAVCRQTMKLDFESDPADEIIASTSIVHKVPLVTRDKVIRKSKMVPFPRR